jgi:hypothetical protein
MSYSKYNPPPQGLFLPSSSAEVFAAYINRKISPTPYFPYIEGIPPGTVSIQNNGVEEYTFVIDFTETPFTYLNASNVTNVPSPSLNFFIKKVPIGAMFMINGPSSYQTGATGRIVLQENPPYKVGYALDILPQTIAKNQLVIRNSQGLVAKALN